MKGMGQDLSAHYVLLCKVRLVGAWIRGRKRVEWEGESNVDHMWEKVKWAMVEAERECGSISVGVKNP